MANLAGIWQTETVTDETRSEQTETAIGFGILDGRGREIGATVKTYRSDVVEISPIGADGERNYSSARPVGVYFCFFACGNRNGAEYGGGSARGYFLTATERDAAVEKYLADARKRAPKIAEKFNAKRAAA